MNWFLVALLAAFSISIYYTVDKYLTKRVNLYIIPSGIFLIGSMVLFIVSILKGIPSIGPGFISLVIISLILNVIATLLILKSLKMTDISLAMPMISFTPIFLIFTSFIILGEVSSTIGIFGIFFIFLGSYLINLGGKGILAPFKSLIHNKGTLYMLFFAFVVSVVVNIDKIIVNNSDPVFGPAVIQFLIGITFFIISYKKGLKISNAYRKNAGFFILGGIGIGMAAFLTFTAFTMQIVPYVMSIQRMSVIFTVLYGFLFFKEKHIKQRLIGTIIMLIGAAVITVL